MNNRDERMIQFRLADTAEICLMRVSGILCLFPDHYQIRTIEHSWTLQVLEDDWPKVEKAFRSAYLGMPVHAARGFEKGL
jgi:hypothetical protein